MAFRGGIVCISNRELHDDDLLGAFKSRVHTLNYDPSDAQLGALMLDIADRGWPPPRPAIEPEDAHDVARFLIGEMLRLGCRFDLRLFVNKALPDYQQWKDDETESDWRDLVTASIEQHLVAVRHAEDRPSRADRKQEEHAILREILQEHPTREERVRAWIEPHGQVGAGLLPAAGRDAVTECGKCQTVKVTGTAAEPSHPWRKDQGPDDEVGG